MEKNFEIIVDYINETITDGNNVFVVGNMGDYKVTDIATNHREILKITKTHVWFKTIYIDPPDKVSILRFSKINFGKSYLTKEDIYVLNDVEIDDKFFEENLKIYEENFKK